MPENNDPNDKWTNYENYGYIQDRKIAITFKRNISEQCFFAEIWKPIRSIISDDFRRWASLGRLFQVRFSRIFSKKLTFDT